MRFKRFPRHPFNDTNRKRSALRRKQRLEREALPLLAELVAEAQTNEDAVMRERASKWCKTEVQARNRRAERWREARRKMFELSNNERALVRHAWNCAPYPADPVYLLDFLHGLHVGRLKMNCLPFDLVATDQHGCRLKRCPK